MLSIIFKKTKMRQWIVCILGFLLLTTSCGHTNNKKENNAIKNDSAQTAELNKKNNYNPTGIITENEFVQVLGDTTIDNSKIRYFKIKFEPYISFTDYKVYKVYKGKKAPIDYNSNKTAKMFKTRITEGYKKEGANFAGHYCFIYWGCGSPCQESAIVDLTDGKVYDGPSGGNGYDFCINSRMLIVNPPDSDGFYIGCFWAHPEIWIFNERTKKFSEIKSAASDSCPSI
jgi:hypothetical protein